MPGSDPFGEAAQAPTQTPVEAGAALLWGARAKVSCRWVLSSMPTPTYIAAEIATIRADMAARSA